MLRRFLGLGVRHMILPGRWAAAGGCSIGALPPGRHARRALATTASAAAAVAAAAAAAAAPPPPSNRRSTSDSRGWARLRLCLGLRPRPHRCRLDFRPCCSCHSLAASSAVTVSAPRRTSRRRYVAPSASGCTCCPRRRQPVARVADGMGRTAGFLTASVRHPSRHWRYQQSLTLPCVTLAHACLGEVPRDP